MTNWYCEQDVYIKGFWDYSWILGDDSFGVIGAWESWYSMRKREGEGNPRWTSTDVPPDACSILTATSAWSPSKLSMDDEAQWRSRCPQPWYMVCGWGSLIMGWSQNGVALQFDTLTNAAQQERSQEKLGTPGSGRWERCRRGEINKSAGSEHRSASWLRCLGLVGCHPGLLLRWSQIQWKQNSTFARYGLRHLYVVWGVITK